MRCPTGTETIARNLQNYQMKREDFAVETAAAAAAAAAVAANYQMLREGFAVEIAAAAAAAAAIEIDRSWL